MAAKRKKKDEMPVFGSLRKPTAPPSKKLGTKKPETKAHPAERKIKYKKRSEVEDI